MTSGASGGDLAVTPQPQGGEFNRGWKVLLAAMFGIGCGLAAIPFYTIGVFAPHLQSAFGWSLGEIMGGLTITTLAVMVAAPITGMLSDRFGTRPVALCSVTLFGLSWFLMAIQDGSILFYYAAWAVISVTGAGTLPITWTRSVNRWFDQHRGLALGIAMMGNGLFGILSKPLLAWVIGDYGWRAGYVALGLLPLFLALPLALLLFRDPHVAMGSDDREAAPARPTSGLTRSQALRSWRFYLIAIALVPISFALAGAVPNLEPILTEKGLDAETIVSLTPLVGLASIVGRLIGGWLLDRFWAPAVAFVILGVPAISCLILAGGALHPAMAGLAIFMIGFALGIEYDAVAYLTSRYFGMRAYAAIYAIFYVCFATGAGFAPLAFGIAHDTTGNFTLALYIAAVILPFSAASFLLLGRYPKLA